MRRLQALLFTVASFAILFQPPVASAAVITLRAPDPPSPAASAPAAPSNLMVVAVTTNQVTLTWTLNSNDATTIHVEVNIPPGAFQEAGSGVPGNTTEANVGNLQPGTTYGFRVRASNGAGFSGYSNTVMATTMTAGTGACTANATTLCLIGNRFQVTATWTTGTGATGPAETVDLTDDSGYLWFFDASNAEVLLKVLNGCPVNNKFWFFAAGLTNVRVVIQVKDTQTGAMNVYTNNLNNAFPPFQDTSAFDCP